MAKVFAMYKHPADAAAFDSYYYRSHVPLAKKIPGLKRYDVTRGPISSIGGGAVPYYLIAVLTFDSLAAIQSALTTPEGQATAADLAKFATGGVDLYAADDESI
ncbi:MAG: EthD family reductase [Betaproteobacteria bacterium]|nr:MAG: EthD family reductase [Betaproteobacteria bacterium]TMH01069.1 MAG: EthD family reductase [Betaproteobacteria bacterium]